MREEDVFPVTYSVEIACIDDKLSLMMLWLRPSDHDGPSTSKSIPLQSTGLSVTLIPPMINANPTITPGETTVWSCDGGFMPIGDVVAGDVWLGSALQQAYKPSVRPLSAYCRQSEHWWRDCASWCNSGSCCRPGPVLQVWCTDPVQVLLHVVCHCEDNRLFVLSPCSTVLGFSQYGHCNLFPWLQLQSSCFLAACLSHRWAGTLGILLLVFFRVRRKASLASSVFITVTLFAYRL
jgi:hypothetical protein